MPKQKNKKTDGSLFGNTSTSSYLSLSSSPDFKSENFPLDLSNQNPIPNGSIHSADLSNQPISPPFNLIDGGVNLSDLSASLNLMSGHIDQSQFPTRKERALYQIFIQHLEKNNRYVDNEFNLKLAAREIGTNEKYLSTAINHCSGMSFIKILNKYRIIKAQQLIYEDVLTRLNLEEIAYLSGYGNRTTFYRVFTEMVGVTPSRYRDNLNRGIQM